MITQEELDQASAKRSNAQYVNKKDVMVILEEENTACFNTLKHFNSVHQTIIGDRLTEVFTQMKKRIKELKIQEL